MLQSERAVNYILITILRFLTIFLKRLNFLLDGIFFSTARQEDHFQEKSVQNRPSVQIL